MKSKKIKNALLVTISLALVAAASVAITWAAYLGGSMGDQTNTFTSSPVISLGISEPNWTGTQTYTGSGSDGYKDASGGSSPDALLDGITSTNNGSKKAESYYVGETIEKDPRLTNTTVSTDTTDSPEYVGMKVKFYVKVGTDWKAYPSYTQFAACIATVQTGTSSPSTGFNTSSFNASGNKTDFYIYKNTLARHAQTANLFDSVKINDLGTKDTANNASAITYSSGNNAIIQGKDNQYSYVYYDGNTPARASSTNLPEFKIEITGYGVQASSFATL